MKVMVTGGCGFLGSHVCTYYRKMGWDVISYDNMTKYELERTGFNVELARNYNRDLLNSIGVEILTQDIRNFDELLTASDGCDYIIHTAAQPAMTLSVTDPVLDFTTNALGTFNVLEAARIHQIPVATCGTIHIYGTGINDTLHEEKKRYIRDPVAISESHPVMTGTLTPLHASKKSGEDYLMAYIHSYGVKAATFRLTGLYGENQFGGEDHGWAAHFTISAIRKKAITLFGNGKQLRDIVFATDVCTAFHAFYEKQQPGIYNIGGGETNTISLLECIDYLEEVLGRKVDYQFGGERHGDLKYFVSDTSLAKKQLGWEPTISPQVGLKRLHDWVLENKRIFNV
ncbi:MAG: NAD-dependent epimerase/dehydratase family protein [Magnetococcales bacterium]|nr:NAD-dependent epimerase/dehydratase family protein [Magnetococcales bacterium]